MSVERTRQVIERYLASGGIDTAVAKDAVYTDVATGETYEGREAIRGLLDHYYRVAFNAEPVARGMVYGDGHAAGEWDFVGKHVGEFAGIAPTGKTVRVPLAVFYDVSDDAIQRARVYFARAEALRQLQSDEPVTTGSSSQPAAPTPPPAQSTDTFTTSGSLASVPVPEGWQAQYAPDHDTVFLSNGGESEILVSIYAPADPVQALQAVCQMLGVPQYASHVKPITFAGLEGASLQVDAQIREWRMGLQRDSLLLSLIGRTQRAFTDLEPALARIATDTQLAEAQWPPAVAGTYQIGSMTSSSYGGAIFAQDYMVLHPNGVAEKRFNMGGGVGGISPYMDTSDAGSRWQVRGDRLFLFGADGSFDNWQMKVFRNGLELVDSQGNRTNAVRQ